MKIPPPFPNYPTDWATYIAVVNAGKLPGRFPKIGNVNRFGARYNAAKSYRGAAFPDYATKDTAEGYSSLLGLILAASVFEYYYKFVHFTDVPGITELLWFHHGAAMNAYLHQFETNILTRDAELLFEMICEHVDKRHQESIASMVSERDIYLIRVLQAVRHGFVHGHVTPNMGGVQPNTVIQLCQFGYGFFMDMMNTDFSRLIIEGAP